MAEVKIWYDQEGDRLEVIFEDTYAYMEELEEDVFERRTSQGCIVGFTVLNFSKHDRDKFTLPLAITAIESQ